MFGTLWLRLHRKWRYASTSIEYRASQILYLLLSPTSALIWCRHAFLLQPSWHFARNEHEHNGKKNLTRAKYSMQIWFNQIQSQQLYSKRKSKNFVAFGVKCDWKLAILQISWIVWMVACWFFALPLSLTPCSNHSMMINIFSRFMTTENPSRPKKKCQPFLFRLPLNPFTHWLRFQFSIEIYPSIQINHLFLLRASSESLSPISIAFTLYLFTSLLIYLALFRLSLAFCKLYTWNWGPNHFVRKSIKSKMVWLMADMRILLILWKCGNYFAFDVFRTRYIK